MVKLDGVAAGDLRTVATDLRGRLKGETAVIVLASDVDGKVPFVVGATQAAVDKGIKSGDLVKLFGEYVGGRGGGKPDMAQGSGNDVAGVEAGFSAVRDRVANS